MKRLPMILGIGLAGLAGYFLEPSLVSRDQKAATPDNVAAPEESTPAAESADISAPEAPVEPDISPFDSPTPASEADPSPFDLPPVENLSPEPPPAEPAEESPIPGEPAEPQVAEPAEEPPSTEPGAAEPKVDEPKVEETGTSVTTDAEDIVNLMKASFGSGAIKEFKSGKPKAWKATEPEKIGDVVYQTGLVSYEADTVLGPQTATAKALIRDGAVVKWVSAKTGMELK